MRVYNQLPDVHISEESRVGSKWVTTHAPFRKHVRAELRTLLLHDDRQTSVAKKKKKKKKKRWAGRIARTGGYKCIRVQ
jgi:hypothetical protein